jgi:hypothetical protein
MIPILIRDDGGYTEIILSFVGTNNSDNFPPIVARFATKIDARSFGIPFISELWVAPVIFRARRLFGSPEDNEPGGDSGEFLSPDETLELMEDVDIEKILSDIRDDVGDGNSLSFLIDQLLESYRGY